jgi:hypothetical protein
MSSEQDAATAGTQHDLQIPTPGLTIIATAPYSAAKPLSDSAFGLLRGA